MHTHAFWPIRLHSRTERGWAVIRSATGAIAVDGDGKLIMKLASQEAAALAAEMSAFAAEATDGAPAAPDEAQEKRRA